MTTKPEKQTYTHYGLAVYTLPDDSEWAIGTEAQATKAARQYCRESLWAFNTRFIMGYVPGPATSDRADKAVKKMQEELCEEANEIIAAMLGRNLKAMIEDAIDIDGRGSFLSSHDGTEWDGGEVHPMFKGKLAYRIN